LATRSWPQRALALLRNRNHSRRKRLKRIACKRRTGTDLRNADTLPDGRDSREYLAHLRELEAGAKAAKRGAWSKVNL